MRRWYLVHTKPLVETVARANLQRQGYCVYLPRLVHTVRRRQRWRETIGPLFPRYLFLSLDEGRECLKPVHSTLGVSTVVRFGSQYGVVPDHVVTALRERADPHSGLHRLSAERVVQRGALVRVAEGPFEGLDGIFEREEGGERVLILLTLLGQEARVHVPARAIGLTYHAA